MAHITPASHIKAISGRFSRHDRTYTRTLRHSGDIYGVALEHPNRLDHPTDAQQQAQTAFKDTWQRADALLADDSLRNYFTQLWHAHTNACLHHKPMSLSTFTNLTGDAGALARGTTTNETNVAGDAGALARGTTTNETNVAGDAGALARGTTTDETNTTNETNTTTLFPLLHARRTPFASTRTMLFHLLYHQ